MFLKDFLAVAPGVSGPHLEYSLSAVTKAMEKYSDSTSAFSLSVLVFCDVFSSLYRSPILAFVLVLDCTYLLNTLGLALEFLFFLLCCISCLSSDLAVQSMVFCVYFSVSSL